MPTALITGATAGPAAARLAADGRGRLWPGPVRVLDECLCDPAGFPPAEAAV